MRRMGALGLPRTYNPSTSDAVWVQSGAGAGVSVGAGGATGWGVAVGSTGADVAVGSTGADVAVGSMGAGVSVGSGVDVASATTTGAALSLAVL